MAGSMDASDLMSSGGPVVGVMGDGTIMWSMKEKSDSPRKNKADNVNFQLLGHI